MELLSGPHCPSHIRRAVVISAMLRNPTKVISGYQSPGNARISSFILASSILRAQYSSGSKQQLLIAYMRQHPSLQKRFSMLMVTDLTLMCWQMIIFHRQMFSNTETQTSCVSFLRKQALLSSGVSIYAVLAATTRALGGRSWRSKDKLTWRIRSRWTCQILSVGICASRASRCSCPQDQLITQMFLP